MLTPDGKNWIYSDPAFPGRAIYIIPPGDKAYKYWFLWDRSKTGVNLPGNYNLLDAIARAADMLSKPPLR